MESFKQLISPSIIYGIAWWISVFHPFWGFVFLTLVGFVFGFIFLIKNYFLQTLAGIGISILLGFIAPIPIIGQMVVAVALIYFLYKRFKIIVINLPLIIIGFFMYYLLFYTPLYFHELLLNGSDINSVNWRDFFTGTGLFLIGSMILLQMGFDVKKIFIYTIGLPAFIFIFHIAKEHSPLNDYFKDL